MELTMAQNATVLEIENVVQTSSGGGADWKKATRDQSIKVGDRIRTRIRSRATVKLTDLYMVRMEQLTTMEITPAVFEQRRSRLDLKAGAGFLFSREKDGEIDVRTPAANGALRGTQLFVRVDEGGRTRFQVLEGSVEMSNSQGQLTLGAGEAGEAVPGQAPRRTAVIEANNILRWALYYPAVLDPADLGLRGAKSESLTAYRKGNLLAAVGHLPATAPGDADGRLYYAGVLMSVGRLDEARVILTGAPENHPGRRALDRMIAAVLHEPADEWQTGEIQTASEAMAESYFLQSQARLTAARDAALRATELAPENGFAWTRLAELEFSAGHPKVARAAIEKGLAYTPENARSHALRGFILSSENRIGEARDEFETAVRLDGSFGNGWLGLGLTKIRKGDLEAGRADLQTAATVEPTSSIFHSYLGKAMSQDGRKLEAAKDLELARRLDPNDPTPLLYSAIEKQQNNRINEAIGDLEESILLNDNRRVYRSAFLLDQDRAVRSANLARIYQDAGMDAVAVREATRAVESDYTSASAHLFLANSFDALRDPDRILLRYETPWFNELLLSNLLAPVGGGPLSQFVSQEEYSKLLEADGVGGSLVTGIDSNSDFRSTASVFGTEGNISYGLDYYYRNDPGDRPNSEFEIQELYGQFKWQASPDDIVYFLGKWAMQTGGDNSQNYTNSATHPGFDFEENQEPGLLLAGWNHRWKPGSNTLLLVGRLSAEQSLSDPDSTQTLIPRSNSAMFPEFLQKDASGLKNEFTDPLLRGSITTAPGGNSLIYSPALIDAIAPYLGKGDIEDVKTGPFDFRTQRKFDIYSAEIQQIEQTDRNTLLLGGRFQQGRIESREKLTATGGGGFNTPASKRTVETDFLRTGLYAYDYWKVLPQLTLIGGVAWDTIDHPENFRNPPVSDRQKRDEDVSGKVGFTYNPSNSFILRGLAAGGMGGLSFDESVRLEPAQLAGFNQAYRTVLSESVAGSVEAPLYQIFGLSAEGSLPTRTWWGASVNLIEQDVSRTRGVFTGYSLPEATLTPVYFADGTRENLDYREGSVVLTLNQLICDEFAVGVGYRATRSELQTKVPQLAGWVATPLTDEATLQEFNLHGDWNSPTGFFAHAETNFYHQDIDDDPLRSLSRSGDGFVQFNAWAGYRFNRNLCEITAGVMNIGDADYQLDPLNPYGDIARERTFFMLCRLSF